MALREIVQIGEPVLRKKAKSWSNRWKDITNIRWYGRYNV